MIHPRVLLPLLIATLIAQPAFAQINPFRNSSATPLNAADIAALTDATNRLLDKPHLASGNTETWTNPAIRSKRHRDRWQRNAPQGIGLPYHAL